MDQHVAVELLVLDLDDLNALPDVRPRGRRDERARDLERILEIVDVHHVNAGRFARR